MAAPAAARSVKAGRVYNINGRTLWSVTTIINAGLPKPAIAGWQARTVAEYAVSNWRQIGAMLGAVKLQRGNGDKYDYIVSDPDAVEAAVDLVKGAPWRETQRKMNIGSAVHAEAEAHILDLPRPEAAPAIAGYVASFRNYLEDFAPEFEATEETVYNMAESYAGTLDAIVRIGGRTFLVDYKTGKDIYPDVALQLNAYAHAEAVLLADGTSEPMPKVDGAFALHLREYDPDVPGDRGYSVVPVLIGDEPYRAFLYVREVMRWMEDTSKGVLSQPVTNPDALAFLYPEVVA